jgi:selenocysteine lyase/cysteine desulfurase
VSNPEELAFVGNTTTGVSTILRAFQLEPEDVLLCTSHTYRYVNAIKRRRANPTT